MIISSQSLYDYLIHKNDLNSLKSRNSIAKTRNDEKKSNMKRLMNVIKKNAEVQLSREIITSLMHQSSFQQFFSFSFSFSFSSSSSC